MSFERLTLSGGHTLYLKAHDERTLFAVNLPVDATERELAQLFSSCGTVESVSFDIDTRQEKGSEDDEEEPIDVDVQVVPLPPRPSRVIRRSGHTAHITFLDSSSLSRALALASPSSKKPITWPSKSATSASSSSSTASDEPRGLSLYLAEYTARHPPLHIARDHADSTVEHFDAVQASKRQSSKYKKGEAIVDEDGFTLVTRGGAYGATLGGGVGVASKSFQKTAAKGAKNVEEAPGRRKKKKKEKPDFYAFQVREKKRKEFMDLRRNFEEDKAKIAKLRESRKFRPY